MELLEHGVGVGAGQVDLVDDGDDREVVVDGEVDVREGLCLDALGCIDDQQHPLAGGEGAAHLVAEVYVARRVDQVQRVVVTIRPGVREHAGLSLDRDPALSLQLHLVEVLVLHLALGQQPGVLDEAICQGRFAVVDVRDDREVANALDDRWQV